MKKEDVIKRYRNFYAFTYDTVFGLSLETCRRIAIKALECKPGEKVLEIGVGTGLTFRHYTEGVELTGVDISEPMLEQARERLARSGKNHTTLLNMDARKTSFADNTFDKCAAMFVATVTPDPETMVAEMRRIVKPGGTMIVANHFSRQGSLMTGIEKAFKPFASKIGFEPLFYLDEFIAKTKLEDFEDIPTPPFGYWRVLKWINKK